MARPEKVAQVEALRELITDCQAAVLVDFNGLSVAEIGQLRNVIRDSGARLRVVKNTLFRRALAGTEAEALTEHVVGPVGAVLCPEDVGDPAKAVLEFADKHQALEVKVAWADGQVYDAQQTVARSKMPGRQELLGMLACVLDASIVGLARSLNAIPTKFARALSEVASKQEEAA